MHSGNSSRGQLRPLHWWHAFSSPAQWPSEHCRWETLIPRVVDGDLEKATCIAVKRRKIEGCARKIHESHDFSIKPIQNLQNLQPHLSPFNLPCHSHPHHLEACISSGIISVVQTPLPPVTFPWIAWPILMMGALWFRHLEGVPW